jgi:beta-galactosidase
VRIRAAARLEGVDARHTMEYTVHGNGDIVVASNYLPGSQPLAMLPRAGNELVVAPGFDRLSWYGRGPVETYIDREFERVGVYHSTVAREWTDYSRPQENGNKTDVRWVALTNAQGVGLLAVGAPTLSVAARHYPKGELEQAGYTFQMAPRREIYLNLDLRQMGVGGIDSWSLNAYPLAPYRIDSAAPHSYRYRLSPVEGDFSARTRETF